jgi:uncharacterized RDD family membrane protein YckC
MGEVYEAEQIESGRRIALKVMNHTLASEQDRKRFLREGRLAASVNHPNVVYIHGSEEIAGAPVIAMELVHGGTLKDRLKHRGPLPVTEAVAVALQIIAGLEAASAAGVLHRDIKPANCFVAADGTVKVGDFGLSISTLARGESLLTATGAVLGTPAYASPEQLRGEELGVTSDIYTVGATLYHLLTGRTPFTASDFVKLITEVLDRAPETPNSVRAEIPPGLSRVILRCLAKDRKARFQTYAELREALLPFRGTEVVPAKPAMRILADLIDCLVAYAPSLLFLIYWSFDPLDHFTRERTLAAAFIWVPFYLWYLLYYAVAEGLWGAGLGKTVCGLRVIGPDRNVPGLPRALLRTMIYIAPSILPSLVLMAVMPLSEMRAALARGQVLITDWLWLPLFGLLFVTMRSRSGYAAIHDLVSRTRVIVRPKTQPRPSLVELLATRAVCETTTTPPEPAGSATAMSLAKQIGPYEIRGSLWQQAGEELLLAFDPALRRKVWIHLRAVATDPVSAIRRDLSRATRLRWLTAGRTDTQCWEAYEAIEGAPLRGLVTEPQPWRAVRFWLLDLAEEISAALTTPATAPTLSLARVWISATGRALVLDFPCPGLASGADRNAALPLDGVTGMQQFLDTVARRALQPQPPQARDSFAPAPPVPARVPLYAQSFLSNLARGTFEKAEFILGNLHSLVSKPAQITSARRAASLFLAPALIFGVGLLIASMINFERIRWERAWNNAYPGKPSLRAATEVYNATLNETPAGTTNRQAEIIRAYVVHHFSELVTNEAFWANPGLSEPFSQEDRTVLRQAVLGRTAPRAEDVQEAERIVPDRLGAKKRETRLVPLFMFGGLISLGSIVVGLIELVGCSIFCQSPILRLFGIAVVDREGRQAKRFRLLWRWTVAWVPVTVLSFIAGSAVIMTSLSGALTPTADFNPAEWFNFGVWLLAGAGVIGVVVLVAVIYAAARPERGLQDRLAGTWLVPGL